MLTTDVKCDNLKEGGVHSTIIYGTSENIILNRLINLRIRNQILNQVACTIYGCSTLCSGMHQNVNGIFII